MKTLLLPVILLAAALLTGCADTAADVQAVRRDAAAVTNLLLEANMKLNHQEQLSAVAQMTLTNQLQELARLSNSLASLREQFITTRSNTLAAQAEVLKRDLGITELEAQRDEQARKAAAVTEQVKELQSRPATCQDKLARAEAERADLVAAMERLKIENTDLRAALNDRAALVRQIKAVEQQTSKRAKAAAVKPRLELQPDGSVRLTGAASAADAKR